MSKTAEATHAVTPHQLCLSELSEETEGEKSNPGASLCRGLNNTSVFYITPTLGMLIIFASGEVGGDTTLGIPANARWVPKCFSRQVMEATRTGPVVLLQLVQMGIM